MRKLTLLACVMASMGAAHAEEAWKQSGTLPDRDRAASAFSEDPYRQFDFWIGEWDVNLLMLQEDLSWKDAVAARASIYPILNGRAILELWDSGSIKGYSLRYFDPQSDEWVLWLNWPGKNRSNASSLTGAFRHGRGEFRNSYENAEGEQIVERYAFTDIYPDALRWDDLYSKDGGETWRKNWRMEWTRAAPSPPWPIAGDAALTYDDGSRCDAEAFRSFDAIAGHWVGTLTSGDNVAPAELRGYHVLDGCAVMAFLRSAGRELFFFNFYSSADGRWESHVLSDDPAATMIRLFSDGEPFLLSSTDGATSQRWSVGDVLTVGWSGADAMQFSGQSASTSD